MRRIKTKSDSRCLQRESLLAVKDLGLKRNENWLWQGLAFNILPGELLQVVGENGSGKTSLLRVLAGLTRPTQGDVFWNGNPINYQDIGYKENLHYLGHQTAVKMDLTVFENLKFNTHQAFSTVEINQIIARVGLSAVKNIQGFALSQGQKQRLGLARLLLHDVPIWIVDEPLAGLDENIALEIQKILSEKLARGGMIILTTHRPLTFSLLTVRIVSLLLQH